LDSGELKGTEETLDDDEAVVARVAADKTGIGYARPGEIRPGVRRLPIAPNEDTDPVTATAGNFARGAFPLARPLWLSLNHAPDGQLDPLRREFLRFVFSKPGQVAAVEEGYLPIAKRQARRQLQRFGIPD
jgi:phosphate transport system substrate-binding protein